MTENLKIAAAQLNPTACDVAGNVAKIIAFWRKAEAGGAELVVTPEQSIAGYPLEDTAKNPDVLDTAQKGLAQLIEASKTMASGLIVGLPEKDADGNVYNAAYLIDKGTAERIAVKRHLPNNDVFDEKRIYTEGTASKTFLFRGRRLGCLICEDLWHPDVAADLAAEGAEALIAINASPFYAGEHRHRLDEVITPRARETGLPVLYVNQTGGQDELVFDGRSTAVNADGALAAMMPGFDETLGFFDLKTGTSGTAFAPGPVYPVGDPLEETYRALVVGTRDYLKKMNMQGVLLGMSGGIDSALVAAIAADALGPQNVHLYKLPSQFSSADSRTDADDAAAMLGAPIDEIAIAPVYQSFMDQLAPHFNGAAFDATEENLQARIRGTVLMALSNKKGWLLLSTGNKSEVSVGFCTLYGDMNGGFNPLKDVWKMSVYALSKWRNAHHCPDLLGPRGKVIPDNILAKEPSAELGPNQKDSDSLPPYPVLDEILKRYVEHDMALEKIAAETGFPRALVDDIVAKVDRVEFKRRQACPGVKITECNFGKGRRVPIVRPNVPKMKRDCP